MRWTTEEISEGVGRIWKVSSGKWCFETVYGHKGGPMNKACAQSRMECHWATQTRERAGLAQKMDRRDDPKQKSVWQVQEEILCASWSVGEPIKRAVSEYVWREEERKKAEAAKRRDRKRVI